MNFDNMYYLNLAIRISDYKGVAKYINRCELNPEIYDNISYYCTDLQTFKLIEKYIPKGVLNKYIMTRTTFNNTDVFKYYVKEINGFNESNSEESILLNTLNNKNSTKKWNLFDYLFNNIDFNSKNINAETNSQIMLRADPTNTDGIYLEKLERLTKDRSTKNDYLFKCMDSLSQPVENFIDEPAESLRINFNDIEYHLLRLNMKLKKMFSFTQIKLADEDTYKTLTDLHISILNNFILNKLLLDKI
jgi:hypothetical protein